MSLDREQLLAFGLRLAVVAEDRRLRGTVDVGIDQSDLLAHAREGDGEVG